jgi:tellurite resistance protein TerC
MTVDTVGTPAWWAGFMVLILGLLALDLGVLQRRAEEMSFRKAAVWTAGWVSMAGAFCAFIWVSISQKSALLFAQGYVVEQALSVDNVFVFGVIFDQFRVPRTVQHRVLFWGILGALVLRAVFIGIGTAAVQKFEWLLYLFGALLIYTGIKLLFSGDDEASNLEDSRLVKTVRRFLPMTQEYKGEHFFVTEGGKTLATPLFLVLIAVEASDLLFAVDSIPAVIGITPDPFIVYTSNIFAILGLRSLYFLVAALMSAFHYLKVGLSVILSFIGFKMIGHHWVEVPTGVSLAVIFGTLLIAIIASIVRSRLVAEQKEPN